MPPSQSDSGQRRKKTSSAQLSYQPYLQRFGIARLRPGQSDVIESIMRSENTLAIMPTGAGKSLCYQLPALMMKRLAVVISPLISLMQDQLQHLEQAGIAAEQVNSALNATEEAEALERIRQGKVKIVFVTAERMRNPEFVKLLEDVGVGLFVIDEAHCISQWGHDFRPDYLELSQSIKQLGNPPLLALTATATEDVTADIKQQLGLSSLRIINTGIYRKNLHFRVRQVTNEEEKLQDALAFAKEVEGCSIIYTATVKAAQVLHAALVEHGEHAALYHGKLSAAERRQNQEDFMQNRCRIMVATNAFGMGIDKEDVRTIIHFQMPPNLEAYYQESGRAGRDGNASNCVLLYDYHDKRLQQYMTARHYPGLSELQSVHGMIGKLSEESPVTLKRLSGRLEDISLANLKVTLKLLKENGLIRQNRLQEWRLMKPEIAEDILNQMADAYRQRQEHDKASLEQMVAYAQSGQCRWRQLLNYFNDDEHDFEQCGTCDNCLNPPLPIEETAVENKAQEPESQAHPLLPEIKVGDAVNVKKLGRGRVTDVSGEQITIQLKDGDPRTFMREYVQVVKTSPHVAG